ncbi:Pimeloyl-ACP methyl ester carboxylesterase [Sphingomonas sp. NFR04]|uniref:alpha/beta hydrolase n=1 Tax=Sphingomonas sp. NFR04 TaxID=1566283 RepID=UPI0008EA95C0|nr:alpha/beta hydrolase [Sphingomonas sp. NFR04]SFK00922.1 Pimeloyl-ACP methyl ester carboxylesterase [Sphingomonas sp. NFR04]
MTLLAHHHTPGASPTIIFLPGYRSDMQGSKVLAMEAWARDRGQAFLRFDYAGCGESPGDFEDQTLASWRDDALGMIHTVVEGPVVLVGSSMGGWLMLLVARARPERVVGMVGIAAAPDFTRWGFTDAEKATLVKEGRLEQPSDYGPEPMVTTLNFWTSGEANLVLEAPIGFDGPVRLLQGQRDAEVPWELALRLADTLRSDDVQVTLVKGGDHRLSRDADIRLLLRATEDVLIACSSPSSC